MKQFKLPDLGEGLQEAEIIEWAVKVGDALKADELMVLVETAKAIVEIPAPEEVVIAELCANPGDIVHVGEVLVKFESSQEDKEDSGTVVGVLKQNNNDLNIEGNLDASQPMQNRDVPNQNVHQSFFRAKQKIDPNDAEQFRADNFDDRTHHLDEQYAPSVVSFARRLNVDLKELETDSDSVVDMASVAHYYEQRKEQSSSSAENQTISNPEKGFSLANGEVLRGTKRMMAKTMQASHQDIPAVTLFEDVDIHDWGPKSDFTVRLLHAIVCAASEVPVLNAWFDGQRLEIEMSKEINIGLAVNCDDGLYVPVIKNAGELKVREMRSRIDELRAGVEQHTLTPEDMLGATITLSNFGTLAGRYATPIVVPPQVAIIGAGVVRDEVVPHKGTIAIRRVLPLSLSFDHRAATGADAAAFLSVMASALRQTSISK